MSCACTGTAVHRKCHASRRPPDVILRRSFTKPSTALAVDLRARNEARKWEEGRMCGKEERRGLKKRRGEKEDVERRKGGGREGTNGGRSS